MSRRFRGACRAWGASLAVLALAACEPFFDTDDDDFRIQVQDPLYSDQWHLENTGQNGASPGEDANVTGVWSAGYLGSGVRLAVVDDGLEIGHEDLAGNVVAGASHNYVDDSSDPTGGSHGTAVGGVAAAVRHNGLGVTGMAPEVDLVGYNVLATSFASDISDGLSRSGVSVSNNSWGPTDGSGQFRAINGTVASAIATGVSQGRDGKGIVYVWAAGNGATANVSSGGVVTSVTVDNANYDGYANNRYALTVCAVGDDGRQASYSEKGANLLVCAPSQGDSGQAITTTDRSGSSGYNDGSSTSNYGNANYTNTFNGTSSATPVVAGAVALVLQANGNLTWRDVRAILAKSARQNDSGDSDWATNGAGYTVSHKYGFGVVDAEAAVNLARSWSLLAGEESHSTSTSSPSAAIPDNSSTGVNDTITVSGSGIGSIETVAVTFSASNHTDAGNLEVRLVNTATGTESVLAEQHICASNSVVIDCTAPDGWVFTTLRHFGEAADTTWRLEVRDLEADDTGTFESWQLTFYGT